MSKNSNIPEQGVLFDAEEIGRITPNDLWEERDKPVTCLGREFPNDEARREYFREELKKKLPELRKIEGFPIGKDKDIINLSDPPYYTACPNPWLNDFIAEWEKEKQQLEIEGKRKADFEVKEPYASDVSEGKSNPVYAAHTYHTKVPHPAIMRYILHYTQPGDVIFDGFAGTGMTGVAAQACANPTKEQREKIDKERNTIMGGTYQWGERHAICGDLSPYASFISYNYNTPIDIRLLRVEADRIIKEVKSECSWMYSTIHDGKPASINYVVWSDVCTCPNCGQEFIYWNEAVDYSSKCLHDTFPCPHCHALQSKKNLQKTLITKYDNILKEAVTEVKQSPVIMVITTSDGKRVEITPTEYDLKVIERIKETDIPYWYPSDLFMGKGMEWGDTWRAGVHTGITRVSHF